MARLRLRVCDHESCVEVKWNLSLDGSVTEVKLDELDDLITAIEDAAAELEEE